MIDIRKCCEGVSIQKFKSLKFIHQLTTKWITQLTQLIALTQALSNGIERIINFNLGRNIVFIQRTNKLATTTFTATNLVQSVGTSM